MQINKKYPSFIAFLLFLSGIISGKFFNDLKINIFLLILTLFSPFKNLSYIPLGNIHYFLRKKENKPIYLIINEKIHKKFLKITDEIFDKDVSSFIKAVFLGQRGEIYKNYRDKFLKTGTLHFLAISGFHMAIISGIFTLIFLLLRIDFKRSLILSSIFTILYITIIPLRPSVLRSVIMILFFIFSFFIGIKTHPLSILGNAGLISLFLFPEWAFDPGFHLSYLATTGIIVFFPVFDKLKIKNYILRNFLYIPFSVSISAQISVFPYIYFIFRNIPLISPFSNLLLGTFMFFILLGAILTHIFYFIFKPLSVRFAYFTQICAKFMFFIIDKLSDIPLYIHTKDLNICLFFILLTLPIFLYLLKFKLKIK